MSDPLMPQLNALHAEWTRARMETQARWERDCREALAQAWGYWNPEVRK